MQLHRRKTKGMPHSLFKSSMGGKESRRHANWCSPIYSDSSAKGTAVPAGVTLAPNQPESWQQWASSAQLVQVSSAGFGSLFAWRRDRCEGWATFSTPSPEKLRQQSGFIILRKQLLVVMKGALCSEQSVFFWKRSVMNHLCSLSPVWSCDSECVRRSMFEFVSCPACHVGVCVVSVRHILSEGPFSLENKMSETISQAGLFILPYGFNPFPFTLSVPTGGTQDRHQVSTMKHDMTCASAAF